MHAMRRTMFYIDIGHMEDQCAIQQYTVVYRCVADKFDCGWIFSTLSLIYFHRKLNNFRPIFDAKTLHADRQTHTHTLIHLYNANICVLAYTHKLLFD